MNSAPTKVPILKGLQNATSDAWQKWLKKITNRVFGYETTKATANQYVKLITYTFPSTNNVAAKQRLLLTPYDDSSGYEPIEIEVIAHQGASGLDTTKSKISVIKNTEDVVKSDAFDLVTATAANGTDMTLHVQSDAAAKFSIQVLSETYDTGVSLSFNDGATWSATNPVTGAAASVTSDWKGRNTYTPTISFSGASVGVTYGSQSGEVEIINGMIHDHGSITLTSKGSSSGNLLINLYGTNASALNAHGVAYIVNTLTSVNSNDMRVEMPASQSYLYYVYGNGTSSVIVADTDILNNSIIRWDIWYRQ